VYWPDDSTFYTGEIVGFDNVSGRHHILYDSGDQEHVALAAVKVHCNKVDTCAGCCASCFSRAVCSCHQWAGS
jgi:hypothetical protein